MGGVVIYGIDGHLGAELAGWCIAFGIISGQLGQTIVSTVLKKTGRPSYVVFLLASIIAFACCAIGTTLIFKLAQGDYDANDKVEENEKLFYFGSDFGCDSSSSSESGTTITSGNLPTVAAIALVGFVIGCLIFCVRRLRGSIWPSGRSKGSQSNPGAQCTDRSLGDCTAPAL